MRRASTKTTVSSLRALASNMVSRHLDLQFDASCNWFIYSTLGRGYRRIFYIMQQLTKYNGMTALRKILFVDEVFVQLTSSLKQSNGNDYFIIRIRHCLQQSINTIINLRLLRHCNRFRSFLRVSLPLYWATATYSNEVGLAVMRYFACINVFRYKQMFYRRHMNHTLKDFEHRQRPVTCTSLVSGPANGCPMWKYR